MSNVFVVPDIHGMHLNLRALLEDAGIVDPKTGQRKDWDIDVISLGDLANCAEDPYRDGTENDFECLKRVGDWIDLLIVGNHEHPYWGGHPFGGFFHDDRIASMMFDLEQSGYIAASASIDGILVSHAGLSHYFGTLLGSNDSDEACALIEERWRRDATGELFDACGPIRGGNYPQGGILWSDYSEPKYQKIRQLIGHSVGDTVRQFGTHGSPAAGSYCIDLGSGRHSNRIAGAFIRDGEIDILEVELNG